MEFDINVNLNILRYSDYNSVNIRNRTDFALILFAIAVSKVRFNYSRVCSIFDVVSLSKRTKFISVIISFCRNFKISLLAMLSVFNVIIICDWKLGI